jgi:1-acyl-sn-glycerol-3-phosphate acyltransferase
MLGRVICVLAWTLPCMLIQACLLRLPGRAKERFAMYYWRGMRRILGMRITVIGSPAQARPVVFVVNHSSWLDIIALGSVLPGCFVAKGEIAGWPVINLIARLGRTVFVSRAKSGVARERGDITARLAQDDNIILFPEGTTSDGNRILRFQTAFLAVAQARPAPFIQPVTLVYDQINGLPVRKRDRPLLAWYGEMDLAAHFRGLGRLASFHATLVLDAPIPPASFSDRKQLSAALEARLSATAAALRQGRRVTPLSTPLPPAGNSAG